MDAEDDDNSDWLSNSEYGMEGTAAASAYSSSWQEEAHWMSFQNAVQSFVHNRKKHRSAAGGRGPRRNMLPTNFEGQHNDGDGHELQDSILSSLSRKSDGDSENLEPLSLEQLASRQLTLDHPGGLCTHTEAPVATSEGRITTSADERTKAALREAEKDELEFKKLCSSRRK